MVQAPILFGIIAAALAAGWLIGHFAKGRLRILLLLLWCAVPLLFWFALGVRDGCVLPNEEESCRFGFYAGLVLVALVTPIWTAATWIGKMFAEPVQR